MSIFRRVLGSGKKDDGPKPTVAKLGEANAMYFDKEKGRWREKGKEHLEKEDEMDAPPPMMGSKKKEDGEGPPAPAEKKEANYLDALIAPPNPYAHKLGGRTSAAPRPPQAAMGAFGMPMAPATDPATGEASAEGGEAAGEAVTSDPFAPKVGGLTSNPFAPKAFGGAAAQSVNPNAPRAFGGGGGVAVNPHAPRALREGGAARRQPPAKPVLGRPSPFGAPTALQMTPPAPEGGDPEDAEGRADEGGGPHVPVAAPPAAVADDGEPAAEDDHNMPVLPPTPSKLSAHIPAYSPFVAPGGARRPSGGMLNNPHAPRAHRGGAVTAPHYDGYGGEAGHEHTEGEAAADGEAHHEAHHEESHENHVAPPQLRTRASPFGDAVAPPPHAFGGEVVATEAAPAPAGWDDAFEDAAPPEEAQPEEVRAPVVPEYAEAEEEAAEEPPQLLVAEEEQAEASGEYAAEEVADASENPFGFEVPPPLPAGGAAAREAEDQAEEEDEAAFQAREEPLEPEAVQEEEAFEPVEPEAVPPAEPAEQSAEPEAPATTEGWDFEPPPEATSRPPAEPDGWDFEPQAEAPGAPVGVDGAADFAEPMPEEARAAEPEAHFEEAALPPHEGVPDVPDGWGDEFGLTQGEAAPPAAAAPAVEGWGDEVEGQHLGDEVPAATEGVAADGPFAAAEEPAAAAAFDFDTGFPAPVEAAPVPAHGHEEAARPDWHDFDFGVPEQAPAAAEADLSAYSAPQAEQFEVPPEPEAQAPFEVPPPQPVPEEAAREHPWGAEEPFEVPPPQPVLAEAAPEFPESAEEPAKAADFGGWEENDVAPVQAENPAGETATAEEGWKEEAAPCESDVPAAPPAPTRLDEPVVAPQEEALHRKISELEEDRELVSKKVEAYEAELAALREKLAKTEQAQERQLEELKKEHREIVDGFKEAIRNEQVQREAAEDALDKEKRAMERKGAELKAAQGLSDQLAAAESQREEVEARAAALEAKVSALEKQADELKKASLERKVEAPGPPSPGNEAGEEFNLPDFVWSGNHELIEFVKKLVAENSALKRQQQEPALGVVPALPNLLSSPEFAQPLASSLFDTREVNIDRAMAFASTVGEQDGHQVQPLLALLEQHAGELKVCAQVCAALESLTFTDDGNRQSIVRLGGVEALLDIFKRHQDGHPSLLRPAMDALWNLTFDDEAVDRATEGGAIERVIEVMNLHRDAPELQSGACAVLLNLAVREPNRWRIVQGGCVALISSAMERHSLVEDVLEQGCQALYMLAYHSELRPYVMSANGADAAALAAGYRNGAGRAQKWGKWLLEVLDV